MDVRWKQRYSNLIIALNQLNNGINEFNKRELNNLEKQGLIKAFEYKYELAWNVMKDYFEYQGYTDLRGSRDTIKLAFKNNIIDDAKLWFKMIDTRNITSHSYDEETATEAIYLIVNNFSKLLNDFYRKMEGIINEDE